MKGPATSKFFTFTDKILHLTIPQPFPFKFHLLTTPQVSALSPPPLYLTQDPCSSFHLEGEVKPVVI